MSLGKVVTVDIKYYDYVKLSPHNYDHKFLFELISYYIL